MAANDADIAVIDSAYKLLMLVDPRVKTLAWQDLQDVTRDRITTIPLISDMEDFLNNNKEYEVESRASTIWSKAREALKRMLITWGLTDDLKSRITTENSTITDKNKVFSSLRKYFRKSMASELRDCPSQGKTNKCLSLAKASNHFLRTGDFLRFTDWKFVHKARLNLTYALNGVRRNNMGSKTCRWCPSVETLPHVLNHCGRALKTTITDRHDKIVKRIRDAASGTWTVIRDNQDYNYGDRLQPDLILTNKTNEAMILEIYMPFENGVDKFRAKRQQKIAKYAPVTEEIRKKILKSKS